MRQTPDAIKDLPDDKKLDIYALFKQGSVGYSPNRIADAYDGLELKTKKWEVSPLTVTEVRSSFFENESIFPKGTIKFDNALLMRDIDHEWNSKGEIASSVLSPSL